MMVFSRYVVVLLAVIGVASAGFTLPGPWKWQCEGEGVHARCVKYDTDGVTDGTSFNTCKLTCGSYGALWPKPSVTRLGSKVAQFYPKNLNACYTCQGEVNGLLVQAFEIFKDNLNRYHPKYKKVDWSWPSVKSIIDHSVIIRINVQLPDTRLQMESNESYELDVNQLNNGTIVTINAPTYFGARHALETLSQLIAYCETTEALQIVRDAVIRDSPAYKYRGILLDTSRNFYTVKDIKRTLDAMAANKLNTFHWHITDSHSFPMNLNSLPNMVYYGAYSPRQVYEPEDIRSIVEYGRIRGIRVLPEFDAPAHVGNGFQWGEKNGLGKLAVCVNREPWQSYCVEPPCGQLNLANEKMYEVLSNIYQDMAEMFSPIDLFHYGGDEINLNCWNTTDEIVNWMKAKGNDLSADSYYNEWSNFQERAQQLFTRANTNKEVPGIIWTSHLTEAGRAGKYLNPDKYIIQIWTTGADPIIQELLEIGFNVIFSNYDAWYLDCGFGAWVGDGNNWCSPYKGWQKVYDNRPSVMATDQYRHQVMGGEAALWSEQADSSTLDSRLWPRGSALAERLWSDPEHNWESAEIRFINHRQRLVERGIRADRIQPQWCHQNEGLCYL